MASSSAGNANAASASGGKVSSIFNKITKKEDKSSRSKSPFNLLNKKSKEASPVQSSRTKSAAADKSKFSRSSEFGIKTPPQNLAAQIPKPQTQQFKPTPMTPNFDENVGFSETDSSSPLLEADDLELQAIIDYVDEYYYGVRIFPGQDLGKVFIGWATSRFVFCSLNI